MAKARSMQADTFEMNSRDNTAQQSGHRPSPFVTVSFKSGVLTIVPAGPSLGERETLVIADEVRPHLARHSSKLRAVVIDMTHVQIMSSFGLGWCIEVRNAARLINVKTVLYGLDHELHELMLMMKVDRLYIIAQNAGDLATAIAA